MNHQRNKKLRFIGREKIRGNYSIAIGAFMVLTIVSLAASLISTYICSSITPVFSMLFKADENIVFQIISTILSFLVSLILCIFSVGSVKMYLSFLAGEKPSVSILFWGFKNHPDRILTASLPLTAASSILTIPTSILAGISVEELASGKAYITVLIILSIAAYLLLIIISLPLYMVNYLLADNASLSAKEVLTTSIRMTKGNRFRLFCMLLSFVGWILLAALSCGIGMLWITPYMETSLAAFYEDLK